MQVEIPMISEAGQAASTASVRGGSRQTGFTEVLARSAEAQSSQVPTEGIQPKDVQSKELQSQSLAETPAKTALLSDDALQPVSARSCGVLQSPVQLNNALLKQAAANIAQPDGGVSRLLFPKAGGNWNSVPLTESAFVGSVVESANVNQKPALKKSAPDTEQDPTKVSVMAALLPVLPQSGAVIPPPLMTALIPQATPIPNTAAPEPGLAPHPSDTPPGSAGTASAISHGMPVASPTVTTSPVPIAHTSNSMADDTLQVGSQPKSSLDVPDVLLNAVSSGAIADKADASAPSSPSSSDVFLQSVSTWPEPPLSMPCNRPASAEDTSHTGPDVTPIASSGNPVMRALEDEGQSDPVANNSSVSRPPISAAARVTRVEVEPSTLPGSVQIPTPLDAGARLSAATRDSFTTQAPRPVPATPHGSFTSRVAGADADSNAAPADTASRESHSLRDSAPVPSLTKPIESSLSQELEDIGRPPNFSTGGAPDSGINFYRVIQTAVPAPDTSGSLDLKNSVGNQTSPGPVAKSGDTPATTDQGTAPGTTFAISSSDGKSPALSLAASTNVPATPQHPVANAINPSAVPQTPVVNNAAASNGSDTEKPGPQSQLPQAQQMLDAAPDATASVAGHAPGAHAGLNSSALQMQVGVHSSVFGNVEVHTLIEQSQVGISIRADHELAHWFNSEMSGLENGLKNQHLNLTGVDFSSTRSGVQTASSFQQGQPRQNSWQNSGPYAAGAANDQDSDEAGSEPEPEAVLSLQATPTRVSILV